MTRIARQDARRSGEEDAGHSLFLEECLFGFYGEHNSGTPHPRNLSILQDPRSCQMSLQRPRSRQALPLTVNSVIYYSDPFGEDEDGIGIASDVVKVKRENQPFQVL